MFRNLLLERWRAKRPSGAVVILGMHRSGTSSLAGCLEQCGLDLGEVSHWNYHNRKGNREHPSVISLNKKVLVASGGTWDKPPETILWNKELADLRDEWIKQRSQQASRRWGFKDPRTLVTLPFWLEGLADVQLVGTYRHPASVAKSLNKRGSIDMAKGMLLWRSYNQKLLDIWDRTPFPLVSFDVTAEQYKSNVQTIARFLQLPDCDIGADFFETSLRHEESLQDEDTIEEEDRKIYQRLKTIYRSLDPAVPE
jgi:hypothetical protein